LLCHQQAMGAVNSPILRGELAPSHAVELDTDLPNGRSLPAPSLCQLDGPAVTGESLRS